MTVAELIAELQKLDGSRLVVIQKDSDGNDYSPLADCWPGAYRPITTWNGEASLETLTEEDRQYGLSEEDVITDGHEAIFLCPVN